MVKLTYMQELNCMQGLDYMQELDCINKKSIKRKNVFNLHVRCILHVRIMFNDDWTAVIHKIYVKSFHNILSPIHFVKFFGINRGNMESSSSWL